jgi:hypothetical protein
MNGLMLVKPVSVTPAMLTATDVPETDYAAWSGATTYAAGDRVIVVSAHKVYESLQASNLNHDPVTETTWWIEVSPTNRWKAFDLSSSTRTAQAYDMYFEIEPGSSVNAAAVINCVGVREVRYRMTDPSFGLVYDQTHEMTSIPTESSWYAWLFSERVERSQNIDFDLPTYPNATLRVDLTGASNMAVGVILIGQNKTIGRGVLAGASVGIRDFSRKERNDYGDTELVQRAFARRASFVVVIDNDDLDEVTDLLASVRATPCLWVGSTRRAAATVFGFYNEFDIVIPYAYHSECSIDLEGLT